MPTINSQIASSAADAREIADGTVSLTGNDINLSAGAHRGFFHFPNYGLPVGALVSSSIPAARLVTNDDPVCTIYVEDVDSSVVPSGIAFEISSRSYTSGIAWTGANLGTADFVNLPDIATILQVWADRAGRTETSNLGIMIQGSASSSVIMRTYDFNTTLGLKLVTTYTLPGDGAEYRLIGFGTAVF